MQTKISIAPYLNFNGETAEAMKYYQSILGGDLYLQTFGEAKMSKSKEDKNLIVHASLRSDPLLIMASDVLPNMEIIFGNNVHLSLMGAHEDEAKLTDVFKRLSTDGKVTMPLEKQFWGDVFGMLTDKFGMHWMINIAAKK